MVNINRMYVSPEGDVVEASPHEFATRLKNLGFTLFTETEETVEVEQVTPEVNHEAVESVSTEEELELQAQQERGQRRN